MVTLTMSIVGGATINIEQKVLKGRNNYCIDGTAYDIVGLCKFHGGGRAANTPSLSKVLKGAQCIVNLTMVVEDVHSWNAQKTRKGVQRSVKETVVGRN